MLMIKYLKDLTYRYLTLSQLQVTTGVSITLPRLRYVGARTYTPPNLFLFSVTPDIRRRMFAFEIIRQDCK